MDQRIPVPAPVLLVPVLFTVCNSEGKKKGSSSCSSVIAEALLGFVALRDRIAKHAFLIPHLRPRAFRAPMAAAAAEAADQKVVVHVRSTGDAPLLKQTKFKISGREKFLKVIEFLRRQLHQDTLFVYVNSAFSPNPDELVIDLYNNFAIDGKLVVNYALSAAWG